MASVYFIVEYLCNPCVLYGNVVIMLKIKCKVEEPHEEKHCSDSNSRLKIILLCNGGKCRVHIHISIDSLDHLFLGLKYFYCFLIEFVYIIAIVEM